MVATFTMRETQRNFTAKLTLVSGAADSTDAHGRGHRRSSTIRNTSTGCARARSATSPSTSAPRATRPLIPRSAARATDHGYVAYVIEDDVAKERPLTLGMSTKDGWVEVRSRPQGRRRARRPRRRGALRRRQGALEQGRPRFAQRRRPGCRGVAPAPPLGHGRRCARRRAAPHNAAARAVSLTDVSIKNPVFAWMLMAATMLFGISRVTRIGISQYPDVDYPNVTVSISWPGASPSAVEREILDPLEQALAQVEGVQSIQSQARAGIARASRARSICRATSTSRCRTSRPRSRRRSARCPRTSRRPTVSKSNPDDTPILTVGVYGPFSRQLLSDVAQVPGAGEAADRRRRRADHAQRLRRPQRPHLARRRASMNRARRRRHRHHRRDPARARRAARRRARHRPAPAQRALARRGARPRRAQAAGRAQGRATRRCTSRTWRSSRTASRTSPPLRSSTASRCRRSAS